MDSSSCISVDTDYVISLELTGYILYREYNTEWNTVDLFISYYKQLKNNESKIIHE